jgi:hypothetical protein
MTLVSFGYVAAAMPSAKKKKNVIHQVLGDS